MAIWNEGNTDTETWFVAILHQYGLNPESIACHIDTRQLTAKCGNLIVHLWNDSVEITGQIPVDLHLKYLQNSVRGCLGFLYSTENSMIIKSRPALLVVTEFLNKSKYVTTRKVRTTVNLP